MKENENRGVEDAGARAGSSEADRQERLAQLVLRRSKLSPDEAALLGEVFPTIVAAHRKLVLSLLRSHGVKSHEVDDLCQEVFIGLHNQILEVGFLNSIPAMLNVITTRRAIDYARVQGHAPFSTSQPSSSSQPGSHLDVERALHFQKVVRRIFSQLSPEHREVLDLVFRRGLTYVEAAAALGLPEGTLTSRVLAAKRAFLALAESILPPSQRPRL